MRVTNTGKGCSTDATNSIKRANPAFPNFTITKISDQTLCSPANGELKIAADDGSTGYTYTWMDLALIPIGVSGADAKNRLAGSYKVQITKGTCINPTYPVGSLTGPIYPDATVTSHTDVVDCLNPNSGTVTGDAMIGGVVQPAAGYTFTWYFYNNATGTTGSTLPAANGAGQTRTGLAAGWYQLIVKNNATQCSSTNLTIVEVKSSQVIPTAAISQVAPQTSCDANQPNGILTAVGTAPGYVSPTNFTFEWYRGDNTLAANKIPIAGGPETVSGVKGETLNSAKGGGVIYTVKVITPLNCFGTNKLTLLEDVNQPVLTLAQNAPNGVCDIAKTNPNNPYNGSVIATVTFKGSSVTLPDPSGNYTFSWYDGTTTTTAHVPAPADPKNNILSGLKDGNYAATVTRNDLHCTSVPQTTPVAKATVTPVLSAVSTGSNNCDPALTPDGKVTVSVTNQVVGDTFTYQWYSGNAVVPANALGAGNNGTSATVIKVGGPAGAPNPYTVYVLNTRTGCDNNTTQFVADNSVVPVLSTTTSPNSVCSPSTNYNGSMTVAVTNIPAGYTSADYSFTWYDGNTSVSQHNPQPAPVSTLTLPKLDVGTYSVIGKNTLTGCISTLATNMVISAKIFPSLAVSTTGSHNFSNAFNPAGQASVTCSVTTVP